MLLLKLTMLSTTAFGQIATNPAAFKVAARMLNPVVVAVSARYAGSIRSSQAWLSTQTKQGERISIPHLRNPTDDHVFDVNESATTTHLKDEKRNSDRYSHDHSFDVNEDYAKGVTTLEEASIKTESGKPSHLTTEQLLNVVLEPDDFISDHTFDVNRATVKKNAMKNVHEQGNVTD